MRCPWVKLYYKSCIENYSDQIRGNQRCNNEFKSYFEQRQGDDDGVSEDFGGDSSEENNDIVQLNQEPDSTELPYEVVSYGELALICGELLHYGLRRKPPFFSLKISKMVSRVFLRVFLWEFVRENQFFQAIKAIFGRKTFEIVDFGENTQLKLYFIPN